MTTVELNALVTGEGDPLIILHGLFGSARNWNAIARQLADIRQVHALDLRNHGASPWHDDMGYERMAEDVADYMQRRGLMPADLLGHSMGGKTAMILALKRPELVERLIVVDIAPVSYTREIMPDYIRAMRRVDLAKAGSRAAVEAEIAPVITDPRLRAFLMQNLLIDHGRLSWRVNLAGIAADLPELIAFPAVHGSFDGPTLFLAGEHSDYIRPRDEPLIHRLFPASRLTEIGQSGHWPHADQTERFVELVRGFL
ncbi:MAG TPA: alpha/beta fold hydrolase [Rhodospirillaceae bacterium]|nr:alpha/beta fold hydrolase [Rhodospirillaceae bacterium]